MFNRIVIGIDGAAGGRCAIALAKRLAVADAEFILANVYGVRSLPGRAAGLALMWESEASEALLRRERDSAGLGDAEILRSSEPSVGQGLHEIAEQVKADVLVIGSSHRTGMARTVLGDDTAGVLRGAPCPVAIAPLSDRAAGPPKTIGVGYDGSPESSLALSAGKQLSERFGARLEVMAVVPVNVRPFWERPAEGCPEAAEMRDHLARVHELEGLRVRVIEGDPGDRLARWSEQLGLMLLGTRSQGIVGRVLTGSVATKLAVHCSCPLIVCPRLSAPTREPARPAEAPELHR